MALVDARVRREHLAVELEESREVARVWRQRVEVGIVDQGALKLDSPKGGGESEREKEYQQK